jgi:hypothetical protein
MATGVPFNCSTSNCTFYPYQSLGLGIQSVDGAGLVQLNGRYYEAVGMELDAPFGFFNFSISFVYPDDDRIYPELGPLLARVSVIAIPEPGNTPPVAIECPFYWLMYTYCGSVVGGSILEEDHQRQNWTNTTLEGRTNHPQEEPIYITPSDCRNPSNMSWTNTVGVFSHLALQNWCRGFSVYYWYRPNLQTVQLLRPDYGPRAGKLAG